MLNFSTIDSLLTSKPAKIAVAVSGGADSMCLVHILSQWCNQNKVEVTALIVDHGLRDESQVEALWVQDFLLDKGIQAIVLKWEGAKPKADIQNKAREARYNLLQGYCETHGIDYLFVGHTLNDQAETVLMRVIRGSGIDGISGIKPKTKYGNIILLRPLLNITRAQIEAHLLKAGWNWVNDPSNQSHKYDRIKVRSMLNTYAAEFGDDLIYKRLALLASNAGRAKDYINKRVELAWSKYITVSPLNFVIMDNSAYKLNKELSLRLFVRIFKYLSPHLPAPRLDSLLNLITALKGLEKNTKTLSGCIVTKDPKRTTFVLEVGKKPTQLELKVGEVNMWGNSKVIVEQPGLTAKALGSAGWRYLRSLGYVKPQSVPISAVHSLLAIYRGDRLVYVPDMDFEDVDVRIDVSKN